MNAYYLLLMYVLFSTRSMETLIILHNQDPILLLIAYILISFTLLFEIMKRCKFRSRFYKERYQPVQYRFELSLHILTSRVCAVEEANRYRMCAQEPCLHFIACSKIEHYLFFDYATRKSEFYRKFYLCPRSHFL